MSSKAMSPTATLLRNSRLFSMPAPLPRPLNDFMGHVQSNKTSDTATLPYPIQQAIATTPSALPRGDWGLKRALPLRSTTNTGTPLFRINAVDTREHITDFESASDLSLTLQKFQELNIPITQHPPRIKATKAEARTSVFESNFDNTDPQIPRMNEEDQVNTRWKFQGPWVAGLTQGDFDEYLQKHVKGRKAEFLAWLREDRLQELKSDSRKSATHEGVQLPVEAEAEVELSEQDFMEYVRELRSDSSLGQPITTKIQQFLDLPPLPAFSSALLHGSTSAEDDGPPRTHPSAGLTYILSDCFIDNHPVLGPQARHPPVEARILVAENRGFASGKAGKVGVAGVVAGTPVHNQSRITVNKESLEGEETAGDDARALYGQEKAGATLGVHTTGGNRIWVEPTAALIDSRGRIDLKVANATQIAVDVHTGDYMQPSYQKVERRAKPMATLDSPSLGREEASIVDALDDRNWGMNKRSRF